MGQLLYHYLWIWLAYTLNGNGFCAGEPGNGDHDLEESSQEEQWEDDELIPADGTPPVGPCSGCTPVFYSGLNGSRCFRIPSIIKTHTGILLAAAENRLKSCKDNSKHSLVLRRSADGGATWGPMIVIWEGQEPCPGCPAAVSNPNLVEVDFHNGSYAVLLHFDTLNNPSAKKHGLDMQIWSYDEGLTWCNPSALKFRAPYTNKGGLIGPSVGIQAASGTIYFSAEGLQRNVSMILYYSHDFGLTWEASPDVPTQGPEASIAFLINSSDEQIIMSDKPRGGSPFRGQVVWSADHIPQPRTEPEGLVDPHCQGSIVNQDGVLYLSNPNNNHSRINMTVKSSHDQGKTWSDGIQVWSGMSAYSQLVPLGSERLGLLFEAGPEAAKTYGMISFVVVDVDRKSVVPAGVAVATSDTVNKDDMPKPIYV